MKIQLPGSGSGCDEWRGIVFCLVFLPIGTCQQTFKAFRPREGKYGYILFVRSCSGFRSEYGKVELHHLWLLSMSRDRLCLPKTPGCSIDKKEYHQVDLEIETVGMEVEKVGFCVVWKQDIEDPNWDVKWSMMTLSALRWLVSYQLSSCHYKSLFFFCVLHM